MSKLNCFYNDKIQSDCYYNGFLSSDKCHLPKGAEIFIYHSKSVCLLLQMEPVLYDIKSKDTLEEGFLAMAAAFSMLLGLAVARIFTHERMGTPTKRLFIEFMLVVIPLVYVSTSGSRFLVIYDVVLCIFLFIYGWCKRVDQKVLNQEYEIGKRPPGLTVVRSITYLGTAVNILAVDFQIFPHCSRKSRRFGASIMDSGLGIFVITMGMVSQRPQRLSDYRKMAIMVLSLLILGAARTFLISLINYNQDEHEYGLHLNAFFTLGFTKLFGSLLSAFARSDAQLLPMSLGVLVLHETILQLGASSYVMDDFVIRSTLFSANREGICSIPGFVALYLCTISILSNLRSCVTLSYSGMVQSFRKMALISLICWIIFVIAAFSTGIARVTCNVGYAAFAMGISMTMLTAYMLIFDFIVNIALRVSKKANILESGYVLPSELYVPILSESINMNGLTFFLITNVLTGVVNIFLKPENRVEWESLLILNAYMAAALGFVYVLYRKKIRLA